VSLNMKTPEGIAIAKRLVAISDVVAENFSGRVMPRWGMDYESLRKIRADIIMLSMSGLGRTGPWKDHVSYGQTLQAWSGFTYLTGFPDTDPCGPASAYSDAVGGMVGAQALLMALIHRARTGQGQIIDLSQLEGLISLLGTVALDMSANQRNGAIQRAGNCLPHGEGSPTGAYRCAGEDRWVAISVDTDEDWSAFSQAVGGLPWTQDLRFASVVQRRAHADELDRLVESWTSQRAPEEVMHSLQAAGVAAGVVQSGEDLYDHDPQLKERGFFRRVTDVHGESFTIEAAPYKLSRTPSEPPHAAPDFGEHQDYVLKGLLGMTDEELEENAIAGAFE